jgi:hypothetical protein
MDTLLTSEDIQCLRRMREAAIARTQRPKLPRSTAQRLCAHGLIGRGAAGRFEITQGGERYLFQLNPREFCGRRLSPRASNVLWVAALSTLGIMLIGGMLEAYHSQTSGLTPTYTASLIALATGGAAQ